MPAFPRITTASAIALVVSACATSPVAGTQHSGVVHAGGLDPRIGPADVQRYESIRDSGDWQNPFLTIRSEGVEITLRRSGSHIVAVADLGQALIGLPVSAWPYGRVVAVTVIGIRAPDRGDEGPITENLRATFEILKKLGVTVERWPT